MPFDRRAWERDRRAKRRDERLCIRCGVALSDGDGRMCRVHAALAAKYAARSFRDNYTTPRDIGSRLGRIKSRWKTLRFHRRLSEATFEQGILAGDAAELFATTLRRLTAPIVYGEADASIPCMSAPVSHGERPSRVSCLGRSLDGSILTFEVTP